MPYLIPMLQNAGAIVFTPRERDWQRNEIVIDNDDAVKSVYYFEKEASKRWKNAIRSVCQPLPTERWGKSVPHGNRETGEGYQAQEN